MDISVQRALSVSFTKVEYGGWGPSLWRRGHELRFEHEKYEVLRWTPSGIFGRGIRELSGWRKFGVLLYCYMSIQALETRVCSMKETRILGMLMLLSMVLEHIQRVTSPSEGEKGLVSGVLFFFSCLFLFALTSRMPWICIPIGLSNLTWEQVFGCIILEIPTLIPARQNNHQKKGLY